MAEALKSRCNDASRADETRRNLAQYRSEPLVANSRSAALRKFMHRRNRPSAAEPRTKFVRAIEPWYDWGVAGLQSLDETREAYGRFLTIEWLGFHFSIQVGRFPAWISREG